ncbi:FAD-dependent monooxygenase [Glycomyces algeriensis]|uniref:FAD-dependent oxidoreductase n=1 Tax=Glycomyces algeriensis TaxID=256037 RepID=A0A9W6LGH3_9ACTN|nr:FAD-dependent monooxygenase [Glycomyces algeriensis]MDA1365036.1 FAD-dependent monooxygenase [Glycomyces algeriensis]MDR7349902.1 2-polyprenyl-6-methoxyphenol hydroxylase-like FAD-dependent oxidoreductase [Glycomyces algeriensis]GLI42613.1 FAD-dependent oxidoreductase [Glycomyces algeriensis]
MSTQAEVIVVGAGPTGLLLAGDLAEAGVDVLVLEKRGAELSNLSRAFAVHARTLEVLDARGVADDLFALGGNKLDELFLFGRATLHLNHLDTRFPCVLMTPQYNVERVLRERAAKAGVTIHYGHTVTGVDQAGGRVTVHTDQGDYTAAYVVGADGVRSPVREAVGIPFPGDSVLKSMMLADVLLAEPPAQSPITAGANGAFCFVTDFGDGYWRIIAWNSADQQADDAPVELEEIRTAAKLALGTDFGMHDQRWASRFHSDERQAPTYRDRNVFLAGDAAHCHSPAGGQGMNTGIQDAANLSWKLAAALRGADPAVLDSYEGERHPVGKAVLRSSGALVRVAANRSKIGQAVRGIAVETALRIKPIMHKMTGMISGIGIHYGHEKGEGRLVGHRANDIDLADGTRLYEALRGGRFVVLDSAESYAAGFVADAASAAPDGTVTIVRPDAYIGWAGEDDPAAIRAYLESHAGKS